MLPIESGLQSVGNFISRDRGSEPESTIFIFPNPDRNRLHLGGNEPYIRQGTPGAIPLGTPGFNLDTVDPYGHILPGKTRNTSGLGTYVFDITPNLPPKSLTEPISIDKALELADKFLDPGIGGRFERDKPDSSGVQYIQDPYIADDGREVIKRVGFDFNPNNKHVIETVFQHLNLQTQFNRKPAREGDPYHDPHIPVDTNDIKPGD